EVGIPERTDTRLSSPDTPNPRKRVWTRVAIATLIILVTLVVAAEVVINRADPILKGRVTETLSTRFNSRVELDGFNVSVLRGLEVSADRLRIYPPDDVVAAGASQPLIAVEHLSFHSGLFGLFVEPMHVRVVHVDGLQINIPPREMRRQVPERPKKRSALD